MKIKTKLITIVLLLVLATIILASAYMTVRNIIDNIEKERSVLLDLQDATKQEHLELAKFIYDGSILSRQKDNFRDSIRAKQDIFLKIKEFTFLPKLDESIEISLVKMKTLVENQVSIEQSINEEIDLVIREASLYPQFGTAFSITDIYKDKVRAFDGYDQLSVKIKSLLNRIAVLDLTFSTAEMLLIDQYRSIDTRIEQLKKSANYIILLLLLFVYILVIFLSSRIANNIAKSVAKIASSVSVMASGDLTATFDEKTKDEIAELGRELNDFQSGMGYSFNNLKKMSVKNTEVKEELIATASETSAAATEIAANIESISRQMAELDSNILESSRQVKDNSSFSRDLNDFTGDQTAMVEESTASVTQMISSINSVTKLTDRNKEAMHTLINTAQSGGIKLKETTAIIDEVYNSVSEITEMIKIIQSISAQTNLLAMNAAIEAAHAGDSGAGFSVVADEIRKLAEASSVSSKDINTTVKGIILKITESSESGKITSEAFNDINTRVNEVSDALDVVSSSTVEISIGGKQILEAMENISSMSLSVKEKTSNMLTNTEEVANRMNQVHDISNNVNGAIKEINIGFNELTSAASGLKDLSDVVGSIGSEMNGEIQKFKTLNS